MYTDKCGGMIDVTKSPYSLDNTVKEGEGMVEMTYVKALGGDGNEITLKEELFTVRALKCIECPMYVDKKSK